MLTFVLSKPEGYVWLYASTGDISKAWTAVSEPQIEDIWYCIHRTVQVCYVARARYCTHPRPLQHLVEECMNMYGWQTNCMKKEHWTETGKLRSSSLHIRLRPISTVQPHAAAVALAWLVLFFEFAHFFGPVSLYSFLHSSDSVLAEMNCVKKGRRYSTWHMMLTWFTY